MAFKGEFFEEVADVEANQAKPKRIIGFGKLETRVPNSKGKGVDQRGFAVLVMDVYGFISAFSGQIIGDLASQIEEMPVGTRRSLLRRAAGHDAQKRARARW